MTAVISGAEPIAAYLALPPFVFAATVEALHAAGLPAGSSIVLEKPFGEDLAEVLEDYAAGSDGPADRHDG